MSTDSPRFDLGHDLLGEALHSSSVFETGTSASGGFTVDATPPESTASQHSTAGLHGWKVSPVVVTMSATDALSGVRSISYRIEGGAVKTYAGGLTITRNGSTNPSCSATVAWGSGSACQPYAFLWSKASMCGGRT